MVSKTEAWAIIEPLAEELGLSLFDLDVPGEHGGVLRVFITKNGSSAKNDAVSLSDSQDELTAEEGEQGVDTESRRSGGVLLEECARLSHKILDFPNVEDVIPGTSTLEVSSPGINRKLSRLEHFTCAIGERVKVAGKVEGKSTTVTGILKNFDGDTLLLLDKSGGKEFSMKFVDVKSARVDFEF